MRIIFSSKRTINGTYSTYCDELHSSTARISRTHVSSVTVQREDTQAVPHDDVPTKFGMYCSFHEGANSKAPKLRLHSTGKTRNDMHGHFCNGSFVVYERLLILCRRSKVDWLGQTSPSI